MPHQYLDTPIGTLRLTAAGGKLCGIDFEGHYPAEDDSEADPVLDECARQLREYFAGARRDFDLPLAPAGTAFQKRVWQALARIPYGELRAYRDIAAEVERPAAARAVGAANRRNPLPIVLPCHRVVGRDGSLTGYAGGVTLKRRLLELEGAPLTH